METNKTTKKDIYQIDPRNIVVQEGFNSRVDFGDIDELASQIREQGVLNPITVIPFTTEDGAEKYRLVDGERRYRATMKLIESGFEIPRIPALFQPKSTSKEDMFIQQLMRNEGKPFSEYEYGIAFQKFQKFGYSNADIAKKLGVKQWKVDCFLAHLNRDEKVQELMKDGRITGVDVRHIYQAAKNEQAAVKEILKLVDKAEGKGEKKVSLKDLDMDSAYSVAKETAAVKKGLGILFNYIKTYTHNGAINLGIGVDDVYTAITKGGKNLKEVFESAQRTAMQKKAE
jgi:ParB family chromosome partitioning protein